MTIFREEKNWIDAIASIAEDEGHPYPVIAACEAASASGFGKTYLAVHAKNLFGTPQNVDSNYDTIEMPTRELVDGEWVINGNAAWVKYPHLHDCLAEHVENIRSAALEVEDDYLAFIHAAFDEEKAEKVLSIFGQFYPELLARAVTEVVEEAPCSE